MRRLLAPVSWMYGGLVRLRNFAYDQGLLRSERCSVPVVCVGNLVTGGTGKTPLTEALVRALLGKSIRPAILSRGYGRDSSGTCIVSDGHRMLVGVRSSGDEPLQMARKFPEIPVVVDGDRVRGARLIAERFRP